MSDYLGRILSTASGKFGINMLKPYQILVIQRILEQEDSFEVRNQLVILPTGTGKSLCFLIPATLCMGITVIIYPLLALMNDQMSKLRDAGISCVCIRGGQTKAQRDEAFRKLDEGTKIVVSTPESLQNRHVLSRLSKRQISLLVVDEAHVISQWGNSFRPAYLGLTDVVIRLRPHQILAFTATATDKVIKDIRSCLFFSRPLIVKGDIDRPNIIYRSYPALSRTQGVLELARTCKRPALVFCRKRDDTKRLCIKLLMETEGIPVRYYHAGLTRTERETIENWFQNSHDGILICTSAYGMGVDKKDVRTVIHHRLPSSYEEYLQESGRAGRDGLSATAWVIVTRSDMEAKNPYSPVLDTFRRKPGGQKETCRRRSLLKAMGQDKQECTGCDICLKNKLTEMTADRQIRALVRRWPFRFNPTIASFLLCGSKNINTSKLEATFNPLYESVQGWNPKTLSDTISSLSENNCSYPISNLCLSGNGNSAHGKLLYPSGKFVYNAIASFLRRINDGYNRIVRKAGRLKQRAFRGSRKKIQKP